VVVNSHWETYFQDEDQAKVAHVIEECGEVVQAHGKLLRFGPQSVNPELPKEKQITNADSFNNELHDLYHALRVYLYGSA
jgi:hypothetical protein